MAAFSQLPIWRVRRSVTAATSSAIAKPASSPYLIGSSNTDAPVNPEVSVLAIRAYQIVTTGRRLELANGIRRKRWVSTAAPFPLPPAKALGPRQTASQSAGSTGRLRRATGAAACCSCRAAAMPTRNILRRWTTGMPRAGAVTAADWRGQAGSGRLGTDAVTGHIDDFGIWTADLAGFWRDWSKERKGPLVLAGHSMGGHLVLRAVAEGAGQAGCAGPFGADARISARSLPASPAIARSQSDVPPWRPAPAGVEMEREAGRAARRPGRAADP